MISNLPHAYYHVLISTSCEVIFTSDSLTLQSWKLVELVEDKVAVVYFISDVGIETIVGNGVSYQVYTWQWDLLEDVVLAMKAPEDSEFKQENFSVQIAAFDLDLVICYNVLGEKNGANFLKSYFVEADLTHVRFVIWWHPSVNVNSLGRTVWNE